MTEAANTSNTGRRALLAGGVANPDADLLRLCVAYHEAHRFRVSLGAEDEAEWDRACDVEEDLVDRIELLEAATPRGIGEKARVALSHIHSRLAPGETTKGLDYPMQVTVAVLQDAVRLLGGVGEAR